MLFHNKHITGVHDSATHRGKGHCGFLWEEPNYDLSKYEIPKQTDTKCCTIGNVDDISDCAKGHNNQLHGGAPTHT